MATDAPSIDDLSAPLEAYPGQDLLVGLDFSWLLPSSEIPLSEACTPLDVPLASTGRELAAVVSVDGSDVGLTTFCHPNTLDAYTRSSVVEFQAPQQSGSYTLTVSIMGSETGELLAQEQQSLRVEETGGGGLPEDQVDVSIQNTTVGITNGTLELDVTVDVTNQTSSPLSNVTGEVNVSANDFYPTVRETFNLDLGALEQKEVQVLFEWDNLTDTNVGAMVTAFVDQPEFQQEQTSVTLPAGPSGGGDDPGDGDSVLDDAAPWLLLAAALVVLFLVMNSSDSGGGLPSPPGPAGALL